MLQLTEYQLDQVEQKLFGKVAESPYSLVLNGALLKQGGRIIQVALRNKKISFFVKDSSQEIPIGDTKRRDLLMSFLNNSYGAHDFTGHILEKQKQAAYAFSEAVEDYQMLIPPPQFDNTLRMIIIETHIFSLLRTHEEKALGTSLVLKDESGNILTGRQQTALRMNFITNCLVNNIDITRTIFINRIGRVIDHYIFAASGEYFLALVKHRNLHNPWVDNVRLIKDIEAYPLFKLLYSRLREDPRSQHSPNVITNLRFAYITHCEASAHMGLEHKFPFNYTIFQNLLAGLVLLPAEHNYKFPSTQIPIFVYTGPAEEREDFDQYLTPNQMRDLSEYQRENYSAANSTVVLINSNEAFFKTKGISETRTRITKNMRLYENLLKLNLQVEDVWSEIM